MAPVAVPDDLCERLRRLEDYRSKSMRVAMRYSRNREDAQDAVQEALIKVALVRDLEWETVASLLTATTRNVCIDVIRANNRRERRDAIFLRDDITAPDLGDEVCEQLAARWLASNLYRLSPVEQRILRLSMEDNEVAEIASIVGMSYKGAHSALTRAKKRMGGYWKAALAGVSVVAFGLRSKRSVMLASCGVGLGLSAAFLPALAPHEMVVTIPQVISSADDIPADSVEPAPISQPTFRIVDRHPTREPIRVTSEWHQVVPELGGDAIEPFTPISIAVTHTDESLLDTLQRCVREGVEVSVAHTGCNDSGLSVAL